MIADMFDAEIQKHQDVLREKKIRLQLAKEQGDFLSQQINEIETAIKKLEHCKNAWKDRVD